MKDNQSKPIAENVKKAIEIVNNFKDLVEMTNDQVNNIVIEVSDLLKDVEKSNLDSFQKLFELFIKQNLKK